MKFSQRLRYIIWLAIALILVNMNCKADTIYDNEYNHYSGAK